MAKDRSALLSPAQRHLVTRFGYGVDATLARDVRRAGGASAWFEEQLTRPRSFPDASAEAVRRWWPDLDRKPSDLWQRQVQEVRGGWQVMEDYGRWLLVRRIRTRRPVLEKMAEFWEGMLHVPVSGDAHFTWRVDYGDTIRRHALGRFDELLLETTTHPAMLVFLSAATSTKRAPNENLGRELLELHTLGAGNYGEDDVKASSRILTGWHVDLWKTWDRSYVKEGHWTGKVRVRGFTHTNRKADGRAVTQAYLRYLAHHPDTAHHVCERLATKFVRDDPPRALVKRLAKVYLRNDTAIVPVLRTLVASKEFRASAGKKLRDPSEDVVATYRALGVEVGRPTRNDSGANAMLWQASGLGLSPHAWPRPDGTPVTDEIWASPARALGSMSMHWSMAGAPTPAYPGTSLGKALSDVSRIVRSGVGAEVITVDQGDWDMHTDAGTLEWGDMKRNAGDLASSIAAFFADLGPDAERVTLVTLSEFGRRVKENDGYGTDHGFGNVMFVAGAGVRGGRYYGSWPGLQDTLDGDLLVTTDYRSVLTEVVTKRFGVSVAQVFPGFAPQAVGVMA